MLVSMVYPGRGKWVKIPLLPENYHGTLERVTTVNPIILYKLWYMSIYLFGPLV